MTNIIKLTDEELDLVAGVVEAVTFSVTNTAFEITTSVGSSTLIQSTTPSSASQSGLFTSPPT